MLSPTRKEAATALLSGLRILLLEAFDLTLKFANLTVAAFDVIAQEIDDLVQAIHFVKVGHGLGKPEVALAAMAAEMIGSANEEQKIGTAPLVAVVTGGHKVRSGRFGSDVEIDGGTQSKRPLAVATEIEVEVKAVLGGEIILVGDAVIVDSAVEMAPSGLDECFDFEKAGAAVVAAEEIHKIDMESRTNNGARILAFAARHAIVAVDFDAEADDRRQLLAKFEGADQAAAIDEILKIEDVGVIDAASEGERPIVAEARTLHYAAVHFLPLRHHGRGLGSPMGCGKLLLGSNGLGSGGHDKLSVCRYGRHEEEDKE